MLEDCQMVKNRFIRLPEVLNLVGLSRSHLYALVGKKQFPKPVKLGIRSTAWLESEVHEWIETRTTESRLGNKA